MPFFTIDPDNSVMVFYDPIGRGETKPGALADIFGGEKRFKDPLDDFIVNAGAGISYGYFDIIAAGYFKGIAIIIAQKKIFRLNENVSTFGHGVPGVEIQVYQHLLDLSPVDFNAPDIVLQGFVDNDFLAGAGEHRGTVFHDVIQTRRTQSVLAFSGKTQKLVGKIGRAHNGIFNALDVFVVRVVRFGLQPHQGYISLDAHQQVVEVMGNAAGQGADGFHFLGVDQLGLQMLFFLLGFNPFSNVPGSIENNVSTPVRNSPGMNFHRNGAAVGFKMGGFNGNLLRAWLCGIIAQLTENQACVFRRHECGQIEPEELLRRISQSGIRRVIGFQDIAIAIEDVNGVVHVFQQFFVTGLLFGIFQVGEHVIKGLGQLVEFPIIAVAVFKQQIFLAFGDLDRFFGHFAQWLD